MSLSCLMCLNPEKQFNSFALKFFFSVIKKKSHYKNIKLQKLPKLVNTKLQKTFAMYK